MISLSDIKDLYPFKSNFIKVKGYHYHYIDEGQGDRPMLMIHGNPTWSFMYRDLIAEFSKEYRVIAPDHLGCGLSEKPQDFQYRLETHIDNLESLIFTLKLRNITLVLHDSGAAIGMGFAVRHPEMISRLIILNSAAFSVEWLPFRLVLCKIPWLDDKIIRRSNLFVWFSNLLNSVKKMPPEIKKAYKLPYQSFDDRIALLRFVQDIPLDPEHISYEVLLEIEHGLWMFREMPVCIIWGMRDWLYSRRYLMRWKLYYPQAEVLELDNAGQYLLEDEGQEAIKFIRHFIRK
ncbi:alpha/beta fold hydrolase [Lentisphaerota bacterium ZTH]|nr:alpha/beta fold hydrolase [Lentisphaerota bacterium]WET05479.1 alpha/beta fold hydrolase [Lentisphaerota bacterium ZTH]